MPDAVKRSLDKSAVAAAADYHARPAADALAALDVDASTGLAPDEAARRLAQYGPNTLRRKKRVSVTVLLWNQIAGPIVALLAVAAVAAFIYGEWREGVAIIAVLLVNTAIGFISELRAVRSMEALRRLGRSTARVRRGGRDMEIPSTELTPGDILLLEGGDVVPADVRLVTASNLLVDESALTGESVAVDKSVDPVAPDTPLGDRASMAFKGSSVARGTATAVVVGVGMNSELGRISKLVMEAAPDRSPLERQLDRLGGQLIYVTLFLAALIAGVGIAAGRDAFLMIEAAIALAVAAIPEGLPIVATMTLARGMYLMAQRNALVERLSAVETLGATTIICSDKTGTLTENRMTVKRLATAGGDIDIDTEQLDGIGGAAREALVAGALCNTAAYDPADQKAAGDPLEIALLKAAHDAGLARGTLLADAPLAREFAFDPEVKMMATAHHAGAGIVYYVKGAPETVIARAARVVDGDGAGATPLDDDARQAWRARTDALAGDGLRVLALARRRADVEDGAPFEALDLLGLVGLYDPPRADVKDAIAACKRAGIRVVMITGDHAATARNIAAAVGLGDGVVDVVEGRTLKPPAHLTEDERRTVLGAEVFARVSPAQKLDLVSIYQQAGEVVAMTGDGVNDAPALRKADIGVAMGLRGTQVAREAAAMVLRDDAFSTIVEAVRRGRIIFRNIQNYVAYLLSCNLSEVLVVGVAVLSGLPLPLLPLQILFLNLVTDVFPAFALAAGAGDGAILDRPPRDPAKPILTRAVWVGVIGNGVAITVATLAVLWIAHASLGLSGAAVTTLTFLTIAFAQLWNVFNMRDPRAHPLRNAVVRNPFVWGALALCSALLLVVVYTPALADLLHIEPPSATGWLLVLAASLAPLVTGQIGKGVARRRRAARKMRRTG